MPTLDRPEEPERSCLACARHFRCAIAEVALHFEHPDSVRCVEVLPPKVPTGKIPENEGIGGSIHLIWKWKSRSGRKQMLAHLEGISFKEPESQAKI